MPRGKSERHTVPGTNITVETEAGAPNVAINHPLGPGWSLPPRAARDLALELLYASENTATEAVDVSL